MTRTLRREDVDFLLHDLIGAERFAAHPDHAGQGREDWDAILDLAFRMAEDVFEPIAAELDRDEPEFDGERVHLPESLARAHAAYREAGFPAMTFPEELGGMGLPFTVSRAVSMVFAAANTPAQAYFMLTSAAANLLRAHGSRELQDRYLAAMIEGRFYGTMCLSEPQAGSSLADIRTRAEAQGDGTYRLSGRKMWISGGEHDLAENIVHFVLAKIPGGPPGVKGISLFCVPKFLPDGTRNDVRLMGLNHKLGYRGTVNTALAFGDEGGAVGWLVGEENAGLAAMFHMMNEARIAVGSDAAAMGCAGWLHALDYAKERAQGRPLDGRDPASPMIPIAEHPDVRRMLMTMKAYCEGSAALCLFAASLVDSQRLGSGAERERATLLLDILTPVVKSWPSEFALQANDLAIQLHGGYGYTRDYPVERLWRDNRLNPIHEGTKGIQALDLLGRKARMKNGAAFAELMSEMERDAEGGAEDFAPERAELSAAVTGAREITRTLHEAAETRGQAAAFANATVYLDMLGHVVVGWLWLRQAEAARRALEAGAQGERRAFLEGKIAAARFFLREELPGTEAQRARLARLERTALDLPVAAF
ncbi:MAG: acyl-CoA dehydrogenase [Pseudomonadota bacterium]